MKYKFSKVRTPNEPRTWPVIHTARTTDYPSIVDCNNGDNCRLSYATYAITGNTGHLERGLAQVNCSNCFQLRCNSCSRSH